MDKAGVTPEAKQVPLQRLLWLLLHLYCGDCVGELWWLKSRANWKKQSEDCERGNQHLCSFSYSHISLFFSFYPENFFGLLIFAIFHLLLLSGKTSWSETSLSRLGFCLLLRITGSLPTSLYDCRQFFLDQPTAPLSFCCRLLAQMIVSSSVISISLLTISGPTFFAAHFEAPKNPS